MSFPKLKIGEMIASMPIVQGGMGVGVSLSKLASAVANQGGIGVIAGAMIGMRESDIIKNPIEANVRALINEIKQARELSPKGILGVNIMVALTTFKEMVKASIENKINVIFSGAGLPLEMPKLLFEACEAKKEEFKTKLVPIISSARAAIVIAKKWKSRFSYTPDAFVLEGPKAGGHLGYKFEDLENPDYSLEKLVPEVVSAVKTIEDSAGKAIPVIAGGGIYSGEDIAKMFELGASAVQMGTRFVATHECDADIRFKEAYINAKEKDITIIKSPVGMPGRAIQNDFIEAYRQGKKKPVKCAFHCVVTCEQEKAPYCIAQALIAAVKGNLDKGFAFCGTNASKIDSIISVKELMHSLECEYDTYINSKQYSILS